MRISDVRHQGSAHRILQRALHAHRVPHAYVFHGPAGVGREMLAIRFARILVCENVQPTVDLDLGEKLDFPIIDACGVCESCHLVEADTHPDILRIYRQLNAYHPDPTVRNRKALNLSVEVIRHFLIEKSGSKSREGRAKVFLLREAERCTMAAQNALLKTLEEPPDGTFLILITTALDRLLPTIQSRCQAVSFRSLPIDYVADQLQHRLPDLPAPASRFLARFSEGRFGTALENAEDGLLAMKTAWGKRLSELGAGAIRQLPKQLQDDAEQLGQKHLQRNPDASETDATRHGLRTLLAVCAAFFRDVLHVHVGLDDARVHADQAQVVQVLAERFDIERASRAIREIALAEARIDQNANVKLIAESLFIQLARLQRGVATPG